MIFQIFSHSFSAVWTSGREWCMWSNLFPNAVHAHACTDFGSYAAVGCQVARWILTSSCQWFAATLSESTTRTGHHTSGLVGRRNRYLGGFGGAALSQKIIICMHLDEICCLVLQQVTKSFNIVFMVSCWVVMCVSFHACITNFGREEEFAPEKSRLWNCLGSGSKVLQSDRLDMGWTHEIETPSVKQSWFMKKTEFWGVEFRMAGPHSGNTFPESQWHFVCRLLAFFSSQESYRDLWGTYRWICHGCFDGWQVVKPMVWNF